MAEIKTAEQLAQRALDVDVIDDAQLQTVWSELGSTTRPLAAFQQVLLRRELLTQYQLEKLMKRESRTGFFYGDYKVLYCVGAGTFARVFRAVHRNTGKMTPSRCCAAAYSNPKGTIPKRRRPQQRSYIELFRREGEFGMKLKHPNIVEIHEVYSHGVTHYIVMDFVEGRNLREFYRARRRFDPLEAAEIMAGVMAGLNYALQQGITHRDLKMSNVLVSSDGEPKLVDFGLAGVQGADEAEMPKASAAAPCSTPAWNGRPAAAGRSAQRHLFRRHDFLPDAQRRAGTAGKSRPRQQAGKALLSATSSRFSSSCPSCRCRWRWSSTRRSNSIPTSATKRRATCWST